MQRLVAKLRSTLQLPATTPFAWGKLRDAIACMAAEGKALPRAALELLPTIDSIATQLKVEVCAGPLAGSTAVLVTPEASYIDTRVIHTR